jgi:hypothetical protein
MTKVDGAPLCLAGYVSYQELGYANLIILDDGRQHHFTIHVAGL